MDNKFATHMREIRDNPKQIDLWAQRLREIIELDKLKSHPPGNFDWYRSRIRGEMFLSAYDAGDIDAALAIINDL